MGMHKDAFNNFQFQFQEPKAIAQNLLCLFPAFIYVYSLINYYNISVRLDNLSNYTQL